MKRVLFITTISGFLQQFEMNDVAILQEAGCEVQFASNFYNPVYEVDRKELQKQGIKLHQIDIQKSPLHIVKNAKAFRQLRRIIQKEQIDTVHCHNPMGGVLGRLAALGQSRKIHVIYTAHGFHFYTKAPFFNWLIYYPVEYLLARCTDRLITINEEDYQRARKFCLRKGGRVERIPGVGVHNRIFAPQEGVRDKVRAELGIKKDDFYILAVGELNQNKNHIVLLQAMAQIPDKHIYLGICGKGCLETKLKKAAEEFGIEKRVFLFGFRKDIPRMLAGADCFMFPSKREGLGVAALEAMAAGIPLITSDCRGTKEYMCHGANGFVCKKGTAEEYAQAVCEMRDKARMRKSMSDECLKTAVRFDIRETDKIMRKVYGSLQQGLDG